MQNASALEKPAAPAMQPDEAGQSGPTRMLSAVFQMLDRARVPYCILHGYETYPERITSDVDGIIDPDVPPREFLRLLRRSRDIIGGDVVRSVGRYVVLAGQRAGKPPHFLSLDLSPEAELDGLPFYSGAEALADRHRHRGFSVPAPAVAFGAYLARVIAKGSLDEARAQRLSGLFGQDAVGSAREVARFWDGSDAALIVTAASGHDWRPVRAQIPALRARLRRRAILRRPARFASNKLRGFIERIGRLFRPEGLNVVILGPDGAGKSSLIDALGPMLRGAFPRTTCWGFAPPLLGMLRQGSGERRTDEPHALPPRSLPTSLLRAAYWFAYHTLGYPRLRLALARSTLVLHDRHFVDILVDRTRYRYGGPLRVLRLIWRAIPKPDLVILLDAPAEVLQARKQEVPFAETARQRAAYLALVRTLENGHVVDARQPREAVAADVSAIILRHLATRVARRFSLEERASLASDP